LAAQWNYDSKLPINQGAPLALYHEIQQVLAPAGGDTVHWLPKLFRPSAEVALMMQPLLDSFADHFVVAVAVRFDFLSKPDVADFAACFAAQAAQRTPKVARRGADAAAGKDKMVAYVTSDSVDVMNQLLSDERMNAGAGKPLFLQGPIGHSLGEPKGHGFLRQGDIAEGKDPQENLAKFVKQSKERDAIFKAYADFFLIRSVASQSTFRHCTHAWHARCEVDACDV
jgi:hypothetical protein